MNTSTDNIQPGQQASSSSSKPLWAAVGILGVAVLGMGGAMIYQQRPPAPVAPAAQVAMVTPQVTAPASAASAADDLIEKPAAAVKPSPAPAKKVVKPAPKAAPAPAPAYAGVAPAPAPYPAPVPAPAQVVVAQVCAVCGSIESVTPVERSTKAAGPGVGAVAGGVLGAVLGNQIGQGGGRTAATILGAVGGGFAGNAIENKVRKETVYQVGVRMEDGSRRMVEVAQPPNVGSRVTVEGSTIRTNDGMTYRAPAPVAPVVNHQQPAYGGQ
ncbi:MAG: glycine zipper 2TM domain-containing protein [Polaromonas sp.]|nr:glycine zipper 2TM domain-containing protein [Polaromonas sp.]